MSLVLALFPLNTHAANTNISGRILLQVEDHGETWYISPSDQFRYYLGRPEDAF